MEFAVFITNILYAISVILICFTSDVKIEKSNHKKLSIIKDSFKDFSNVIFSEQPDGTVKIPDMWFYSRSADIKNNEENNATGIDPE